MKQLIPALLLIGIVHCQLDLPPSTDAPNTPTPTPAPSPPSQPPQHQHYFHSFNPGYEFQRPRLPFPYNFPTPFTNQPQYFQQPQNTTNQGEVYNQYNNFQQGQFDPYGPYHQTEFVFPPPFNQQTTLNLASSTQNQNGGSVPTVAPLQEQYARHPQSFAPNPAIIPQNPQITPQFPTFRQSFPGFDYGYRNVAPPQTIAQNIQVIGQNSLEQGQPPGNEQPVVGFYGPPPNLRYYNYPGASPGLQDQRQYVNNDDGSARQQENQQQPQLVIK